MEEQYASVNESYYEPDNHPAHLFHNSFFHFVIIVLFVLSDMFEVSFVNGGLFVVDSLNRSDPHGLDGREGSCEGAKYEESSHDRHRGIKRK